MDSDMFWITNPKCEIMKECVPKKNNILIISQVVRPTLRFRVQWSFNDLHLIMKIIVYLS